MRRRVAVVLAAVAIAASTLAIPSGPSAHARVAPKTSPSPGGRVIHK